MNVEPEYTNNLEGEMKRQSQSRTIAFGLCGKEWGHGPDM